MLIERRWPWWKVEGEIVATNHVIVHDSPHADVHFAILIFFLIAGHISSAGGSRFCFGHQMFDSFWTVLVNVTCLPTLVAGAFTEILW